MIGMLLAHGADGVPAAAPIDFSDPPMPPSPNWWMALPDDEAAPTRCEVHHLPQATVEEVWDALHRVAVAMPRCHTLAAWPEQRQAQWVLRSRLLNFPDILVAEAVEHEGQGAVRLHSRSLMGWSDFGVNRQRVRDWLAALDAALGKEDPA